MKCSGGNSKGKLMMVIVLLLSWQGVYAQLVNSNSTPETYKLKALLDSLYGKKIISGQAYESVDEKWNEYIFNATGKTPAILSLDFMNSMPWRVSKGADPDTTTDRAINWVKQKKGIVEMHWHWDAPKNVTPNSWQGFYTSNTTFDLAYALSDTNLEDYKLLIRDIDIVAKRLKRMQDSSVSILWRPLHEAEGGWFWWGAKGGAACKKLWNLIYDRLTNYHKLNNLIWVWNSYGNDKGNWYPGNSTVDIIAWDYESSNSWSQYQSLFGTTGKLFALGEEGKIPDPANFTAKPWLYFITWAYMINEPTQTNGKNTKLWLNQVYNDSRILTLDDLIPGPKAYAGASQTIFDLNGDGVEQVTLNGSASKTDNGTIISYVWKEKETEIATGVNPIISLGVGLHTITLTITTSTNEVRSAIVNINIKSVSLAFQKTVKVSSTESGLGNTAGNAVDGNDATRWSSLYSDPQWFQIDLKSRYDIDMAVLSWETANAKNYRIEVSDNETNWIVLKTLTNMPNLARKDTVKELKGTGRYVRLFGTARNTAWGYSLWEFEIYGKPVSLSADDRQIKSVEFDLMQNYPNPFNPSTTIGYSIGKTGHVKIKVVNILGQTISELVNETKSPGNYSVDFHGENLSTGIYLYIIETETYRKTKIMNLIK